jgi:hypothetical protein
MQDRFLSTGLRLPEETLTAIALSVALSKDDQLASAFRRFNRFDAKLTNPLTYVDTGVDFASQARLVVFDDVNALLPEGISLSDALAPEFAAKVGGKLEGRFGADALGAFKNPENVDFLLAKLKDNRHIDSLCASAIRALGKIGDARALDHVLPFTKDPRRQVRMWAFGRCADMTIPEQRSARLNWCSLRTTSRAGPLDAPSTRCARGSLGPRGRRSSMRRFLLQLRTRRHRPGTGMTAPG